MATILVDNIGLVVNALRDPIVDPKAKGAGSPYYMYGHRREIDNRLLEKNADKVFKYQKYPLIALAIPTAEEIVGEMIEYTLNIAILTFTEKGYNAEERMENVFKPVLYPLYESFMAEIKNSGLFVWGGEQSIPSHTKIDRFYWGSQFTEGTETSIFTDPIDAIEILDLKISSYINKC